MGKAKTALCQQLSSKTEGYSGSDIRLICREAAMMPMRRLMDEKSPSEIAELKAQGKLEADLGLRMTDFDTSIGRTASTVDPETVSRYEAWTEAFASN